MSGSFGVFKGVPVHVRIHFASEIAPYIEEKVWHASQQICRQGDGSVIFEADVAVNEELKLWIMSWGSRAHVLEPETLTRDMRSEILKMSETYNLRPVSRRKTS